MVSGGVAFGAAYLYAIGSAATHDFENGETWLVVPVVGPFAALAARKLDKCDIDVDDPRDIDNLTASEAEVEKCFKDSLEEALRLAVITADGVLQTFGATLFAAGAIGGEKRLVRNGPRVTAAPQTLGGRGIGLGIRGSF